MTVFRRASSLCVAILGLSIACGAQPDPAPSTDMQRRSSTKQIESCAAGLEAIQASRPDERANKLAAWIPEGRECTALIFAGCTKLSDTLRSPEPAANTQELKVASRACVLSSCSRLDPQPRLCEDPDASTSERPEDIVNMAVEFLSAKLAADLELSPADPSIQRLAQAFAQLWAAPLLLERVQVSPPSLPSSAPAPGQLSVKLEADGRILLTQVSDSQRAPQVTTLAPNPSYDFEALTSYAQAQLEVLPRTSPVLLEGASTVPMQAFISAMDALRGTGCGSEDPPPETCLYTQFSLLAGEPVAEASTRD